jgi:Outer membrane protein and related peptidoglycan-associated (lipo)proteins
MKKRHARRITVLVLSMSLIMTMGVFLPDSGHSQFQPGEKRMIKDGEKLEIKGVILNRDGELFLLRDLSRTDTLVALTDKTKIKVERKGLFRRDKRLDATVLVPGLILEVEGKGAGGRLVADEIEFTEADLKAAITAYAQTAPINKKLSENEQKLAQTSKEVVDTNKRIDEIDQYELVKLVTVPFAANSAKLSDKAKAQLDDLASNAPGAKNYLIEVKGYTDVTGPASKNLDLSLNRADAVVQYLATKSIPLRRMTIPMGYGETKSGATTAKGRELENRVDVRILVNKGLSK